MALIVCEKCGKKISDTASECIHCGAKIGVENDVSSEMNEKEKKKNEPKDFLSFSDDKQEKLEIEFLNYDVEARKWYQKHGAFSKLAVSGMGLATVSFVFAFIISLLFGDKNPAESTDTVNMLYNVGYVGVRVLQVFGIITCLVFNVAFIVVKRKKRPEVYKKRFQKWLMDNKNIAYNPFFETQKERERFESVDLDYDKL